MKNGCCYMHGGQVTKNARRSKHAKRIEAERRQARAAIAERRARGTYTPLYDDFSAHRQPRQKLGPLY
jgi:hypothetical protein